MLHLALFFLSASALTCKTYVGETRGEETCSASIMDHCIKIIWADGFAGHCANAGDCATMKKHYEDVYGEVKDWECSVCNTDGCNLITEADKTKEASTTPKTSGGNGSETSKSFHVAGKNSMKGLCSQWTFDKSCTKEQILASSLDANEEGLAIGECPEEFEKACDGKFRSTRSTEAGSPMTISADETNGCGEAEYVWLTDDCDTCSVVAGLFSYLGETIEEPSCRVRGSEGFVKDFINAVKDGEPLYLGILAAAVLVPLLCCLMCCCCCMANTGPKVTYVSRV